MMYIRYILSELLAILATVLAFIFADIIALFIRKDGSLPTLLAWASTADNPAIGDDAFWRNQMPHIETKTAWLDRYRLCRVWVRRNPAYCVDWHLGVTIKEGFTLIEDEDCSANIARDEHGLVSGVAGTYHRKLINGDGKSYFEWCKVWTNSAGIWYRIQFGWHLHTIEAGHTANLKFTFNRW